MRALILTIAALTILIAPADAAKRGKAKAKYNAWSAASEQRRANVDRLPIRITKPDNARHYKFQDVPLWAARAFEPIQTR